MDGADAVAGILSDLQRYVLAGENFQDLAERVDKIRAGLSGTDPGVCLQARLDLAPVLEHYQERVREASQDAANSFKNILNLVNESFSYIQTGNERSDGRLKYLEQNLNQAARIDSLASLRRHVSGMLEYVRQESKRNAAENDTTMQSITAQLRQVQAASSRFRVQMPGRAEALEHIRSLLALPSPSPETHLSLFVADSLKALRARHGEQLASSILEELGTKQVQPLAPEGRVFCWSGNSVALTWEAKAGTHPGLLLRSAPASFEHKAFIGTRVATFRMDIRSVSVPLTQGLEETAQVLDRFIDASNA